MKKRLTLTLCAAITADGKLDAARALTGARSDFFEPLPGDVWLTDSRPAEQAGPASFVTVSAHESVVESLAALRARDDVRRVLCFGGSRLFRRLFDAGLVDVLRLLVRPAIDGRRGAAVLSGVPGDFFPASVRCRLLQMEVRGRECLLHYRVLRRKAPRPAAAENEASGAR